MYEKYFNKLREECLIRNRSSRTADTYINNIRHFMKWTGYKLILSILVDTFISKISFPMQPGPEIGSISDA